MIRNFLLAIFVMLLLGVALGFTARRQLLELAAEQQRIASQKKQDVLVTIVEGKRREEVAAQLDSAGICSYEDFIQASVRSEGTLFPDTYRFFPNTPAEEVLAKLTANYVKKTAGLSITPDELILASIVEREAKTEEERPLIAGVYKNRLNRGMKLDADPTVQYAKDSLALAASPDPKNFIFWKGITRDDYSSVASPYNTYLGAGLPPSPIANPGISSIQAADVPAEHTYLYFRHKDGRLLLSRTLAEHISKQ